MKLWDTCGALLVLHNLCLPLPQLCGTSIPAQPTLAAFTHSVVSWCKGSTRDFDSLCLGSNPGETSLTNLLTVENKAVRRFSSTSLKIFLTILSKKWPNFSFETKNRHTNNSDLEYRGRSIEKERTL